MGMRFATGVRGIRRAEDFIMSKSGQPATKADQGGQRPSKTPTKESGSNGATTGGQGAAKTPAATKVKPGKKK